MLEVGPGPGGLTRALLAAGAGRVLAIERDRRCIAALSELAAAASGRLELIEADALQLDVAHFDADHIVAVANLPYNIGTPLLLKWMDRIALFDALVLMFQREVAERLAAASGSGTYGRLSVLVQWLCEVEIVMHLPGGAFVPPGTWLRGLARYWPYEGPVSPYLNPHQVPPATIR